MVKDQIEAAYPHVSVSLHVIKTTGDRIQDVALDKIGSRGLFVKEIEEALLEGKIDLAVHSLKDMPGEDTPGLCFVPAIGRATPFDTLVSNQPLGGIKDLKEGAVIGTGSQRRAKQLLKLRPDLVIKGIRGNVDTRLAKMQAGDYDAIVLAQAGLDRLGLKPPHAYVFKADEMIPAPAQGILGLQIKQDRHDLYALLEGLCDQEAQVPAVATQI